MVRLILFFLEGGGETHYVRGHSVGAADILGHSDGETLCKGVFWWGLLYIRGTLMGALWEQLIYGSTLGIPYVSRYSDGGHPI